MMMGEGKNPTKEDLLKLAISGDIKQDRALEIIHHVLQATEKWDVFANMGAVSKLQTRHIGSVLAAIRKNFAI